MATTRVEITLENERGGSAAFEPGATLSGRVKFTPDTAVTVSGIFLSVDWVTRGKGNTNRGRRSQDRLAMPEAGRAVEAGHTAEFPFTHQLPLSPWSYTGEVVTIAWEVTAIIQGPWEDNPEGRREFTLRPSAG